MPIFNYAPAKAACLSYGQLITKPLMESTDIWDYAILTCVPLDIYPALAIGRQNAPIVVGQLRKNIIDLALADYFTQDLEYNAYLINGIWQISAGAIADPLEELICGKALSTISLPQKACEFLRKLSGQVLGLIPTQALSKRLQHGLGRGQCPSGELSLRDARLVQENREAA